MQAVNYTAAELFQLLALFFGTHCLTMLSCREFVGWGGGWVRQLLECVKAPKTPLD